MRPLTLLLVVAAAIFLTGCDGFFKSRIVVSDTPETRKSVVDAVRKYAMDEGFSCSYRRGTELFCNRTPVLVTVTVQSGQIEVCYDARMAAFENEKFTRRMDVLRKRVAAATGQERLAAGPQDQQCTPLEPDNGPAGR